MPKQIRGNKIGLPRLRLAMLSIFPRLRLPMTIMVITLVAATSVNIKAADFEIISDTVKFYSELVMAKDTSNIGKVTTTSMTFEMPIIAIKNKKGLYAMYNTKDNKFLTDFIYTTIKGSSPFDDLIIVSKDNTTYNFLLLDIGSFKEINVYSDACCSKSLGTAAYYGAMNNKLRFDPSLKDWGISPNLENQTIFIFDSGFLLWDNKKQELYLFDYTSRQEGDDTIYILR
ncbi:MAG: hypothetical protein FWG85_04860 [Bacteroidetes bacterium]|nr:hypothetical protein [Bacteroidota bacterium]